MYLARIFVLLSRWEEALNMLQRYSTARTEDYHGWMEVAQLFLQVRQTTQEDVDSKVVTYLAHRCFVYAQHLLQRFRPNGEISKLANKVQGVRLGNFSRTLEPYISDLLGMNESSIQEMSSGAFFAPYIDWILVETSKRHIVKEEKVQISE